MTEIRIAPVSGNGVVTVVYHPALIRTYPVSPLDDGEDG